MTERQKNYPVYPGDVVFCERLLPYFIVSAATPRVYKQVLDNDNRSYQDLVICIRQNDILEDMMFDGWSTMDVVATFVTEDGE